MKSREELQQEFAGAPPELLEYACRLQQEVAQARARLTQQEQELIEQQQLLAEARTFIAELKRQLAQDHAQDMRPAPMPMLHHPSALAKIDLRFLTRPGCDAPKRQGTGLLQLPQMRAGYIPLCVKAFCVLVSYRFRRTMASLFTTPLVCPAKAAR